MQPNDLVQQSSQKQIVQVTSVMVSPLIDRESHTERRAK